MLVISLNIKSAQSGRNFEKTTPSHFLDQDLMSHQQEPDPARETVPLNGLDHVIIKFVHQKGP